MNFVELNENFARAKIIIGMVVTKPISGLNFQWLNKVMRMLTFLLCYVSVRFLPQPFFWCSHFSEAETVYVYGEVGKNQIEMKNQVLIDRFVQFGKCSNKCLFELFVEQSVTTIKKNSQYNIRRESKKDILSTF